MKVIKTIFLLIFIIILGAETGYLGFKYYNKKQVDIDKANAAQNVSNDTESTSSPSSLQNIELNGGTGNQSLLLNPNKIEQTN